MSIRTTVTLDQDVYERVKQESRSHQISFKQALNALLRTGLAAPQVSDRTPPETRLNLGPPLPGVNYDDIEGLIELAEGPFHR